MRHRRNPARTVADETAAHELDLYISNDAQLHRQMLVPILNNLARKSKKGVYNVDLAVKLWGYLMKAGADKYAKEFGSRGDTGSKMFNAATRHLAAKGFEEAYRGQVIQQAGGGYKENPARRKHRRNPSAGGDVYHKRVHLRGYNGPQSVQSAHGADKGKVLRALMPGATRAEHEAAYRKFKIRADRLRKLHGNLLDKAAMQTWGRKFSIGAGDYRVSGIGSDEFSAAMKDKLRKVIAQGREAENAAAAHSSAGRSLR
jgi:hypothetical protein